MIKDDPGYVQAVHNMAYTIDQVAMETMDPIVAEHGLVSTEEASKMMSPEDRKKWEDIESIANVVCETYDVEYDDFMDDVQALMWQGLLETYENKSLH